MSSIIPPKIMKGDSVRVIAPSRSLSMGWLNNDELKEVARKRFETELGLNLTYGENVYEIDDFSSSSIDSRISDLHNAFADSNVKLIISVIGGFNSNQLLRYIDYELIKSNPKILCGYSDITALNNAIYAKTGLVTYSGPHWFSFGDIAGFDYTLEYFKKCLISNEPYNVYSSKQYSEDLWIGHQEKRIFIKNEGMWSLQSGMASGTIIGGNLNTLNLLHGTEYMPSLDNSILFIEDDADTNPKVFDRDLQSLLHQPGSKGIKGIIIGKFESKSDVTQNSLRAIVASKRELRDIPIIGNASFGHTTPQFTFPIGGIAEICSDSSEISIKIVSH